MVDDDRSAEERLRRLEDLEEIRELFNAYRRALDTKDFQAYARLFAKDGVFVAGNATASGRDEILSLVEGMVGTLLTAQSGDDFHLVSNVDIQFRGNRATATSNWSYIIRGADDCPVLAKTGRYEDILIREEGLWHFQRRHAPMDIPAV